MSSVSSKQNCLLLINRNFSFAFLVLAFFALSITGQEDDSVLTRPRRHLDVRTGGSQSPSSKPSAKPSARPSAQPSTSSQPSRSFQPTYPQQQCPANKTLFPFCYNGHGGGSFGYAACQVMTSTVNCGRYDFQIVGTNYTTGKGIDFSRCSNVWTWFVRCIEASFPTCRRVNIGIFRGIVPGILGPLARVTAGITEWEARVEGNGVSCSANCNEGDNRWVCKDKDEAEGIIAFARWVAGYRPGDKLLKPSQYPLFTEPVAGCKTPAPTQSLAPTASPAPTVASAPMCEDTGYPPHITNYNFFVMNTQTLPGGRTVNVTKQCVYAIRTNGTVPDELFEKPLPWLIRTAELVTNRPVLVQSTGMFTGKAVPPESWVLSTRAEPFTVTLVPNAGFNGTLRWSFPNPSPRTGRPPSDNILFRNASALQFFNFWVDRTRNYPAIWQTVPEQNLLCGSGPLCYDELPKIRCSIDVKSQMCGKFDFLTTPAKNVARAIGRTSDVHAWFHNCIQTAYVARNGPCKTNSLMKPTPYNYTGMHTSTSRGSVTTNWTISFHGQNKDGRIEYLCPRGDEGQAIVNDMKKFYDFVQNAGYFSMRPWECTMAPSASPTMCPEEDSFLNNPPLYIALVIDTSYSTYRDNFGGTAVGDQNKDGKANTISDAAIAASKALLTTILEMDNLNNTNTNIGLILFDTVGTYVGNFPPLNANNNAVNPTLLAALEGIKIAKSEQEVITTNRGWTNIDDGLDKAILYFQDTTRPVFKDPFKLMVFLSDGKPTVMGDGDKEPFCSTRRADCSKATSLTTTKCTSYSGNACDLDPLKFCVLGSGPDTCEDQVATKMYASELAALEGVTRVAIGVGPNSDVVVGSALDMIDSDPLRIASGLRPRQVLNAGDLITVLRDLCPQSTPSPTRSPSAKPSRSPSRMPSRKPSAAPSQVPSSSPTPAPSVDICEYDVIDFSTRWDDTPTTPKTSLPSLEYEAYGMMIEAIPFASLDALSVAKVGRAHIHDSGDVNAGMVLVIPALNDTSMINPYGGSIVITLAMIHDKIIKFDLWNAGYGATVEGMDMDGDVLSTQIIPYSAPKSGVTEVVVDVSAVRTITITFTGPSGLSAIKTCRDPSRTTSPAGWTTPEPTKEPTLEPIADPTSKESPTPTFENTCPNDIQQLVVTPENGTPFQLLPLTFVSRDVSKVQLRLQKPFYAPVYKVYVEFVNDHRYTCLEYDFFDWNSLDREFTASCMHLVPVTVVNVWVVDDKVVEGDADIPKCCHADIPIGMKKVKYTFKVYCVSQCPSDQDAVEYLAPGSSSANQV